MINRLCGVKYSKRGKICFESAEDKKQSNDNWIKSLAAWDFIKDMKLDLELGIIK